MKDYFETKFRNKRILILGFAREGISTYRILREIFPEMEIGIADQNICDLSEVRLVKTFFGKDYLSNLADFDIIVKSPGISGLNKEIIKAQKNGVEITSQTKIFFDVCKGVIIGVTGTKGKSTTASLLYEILKNAGKNVLLIGNIGSPVLDNLATDSTDKYYVFELSSHQLFDLEKSPHIAIVTNVAVDHLDWYGNFENYVDAKTHILKFQKETDIAILNYDNLITREFDRFTKGKVLFTSKEFKVNGAFTELGNINLISNKLPEILGNISSLKLIGQHNWDNVMMAAVAAKFLGINNDVIWNSVTLFTPLEHHLEPVKDIKGIVFYNDSFAVDQIATIAAVKSFPNNITLILGGYDRGIDYTELTDELAKRPNVKTIIVIGQILENIIRFLKKSKFPGKVIKLEKTTMEKIVSVSFKNSSPGDIVLFSPAAASFDMFKDYKDRGEQFKNEVNKLI